MNNSTNKLLQTLISLFIFIFLVLVGALGYLFYQNTQLQKELLQTQTKTEQETTETADIPKAEPNPEAEPTPTANPSPSPDEYADWKTYVNQEYGFKFSYPEEYAAKADQDSLYGWPNALVLLYKGGQAYDVPVEVWDTAAEYQQKYQTRLDELIIRETPDYYVTFLNNTNTADFEEIAESFKLIEE
jgi:cytoskeletal protein RodZ